MGPRSFERGDRLGGPCHRNADPPSMGPRSFERGDPGNGHSLCMSGIAFNGAALFRARRLRPVGARGGGESPSMGPRSFERGDQCARPAALSASRLQWGRALSSAETIHCHSPPRAKTLAFNGAALFRARRRYHGGQALGLCRVPSMGPRSFERGDPWAPATPTLPRSPSMGPRSFERGDRFSAREGFPRWRPSMGPRSFERGDSTVQNTLEGSSISFNGAALFRARRQVVD